MRALHLPGVSAGEDPPFRFPDKLPRSASIKFSHGPSFPEPQPPLPSPESQHTYLVRVLATALTRGELGWKETLEPSRCHPHGGAIPGHDVVGIIEQVCPPPPSETTPGKAKFSVGDHVWALLDFDRDGAAADFTIAYESELSLMPWSSSGEISREDWFERMATLPLSVLTAHQAFFIHGSLPVPETGSSLPTSTLSETPRVLILGAAGAVGLVALQLAKAHGFNAVATCSTASIPLISSLLDLSSKDQDAIYDYSQHTQTLPDFFVSNKIPPVDLVLDCVGLSQIRQVLLTLDPSLNTRIKRGGKFVTIVAPISAYGSDYEYGVQKQCVADGIEVKFFVVKPSGVELDELKKFIMSGKLRGQILGRTFELEDGVAAVLQAESWGRNGIGKTVIRVSREEEAYGAMQETT